MTRAAPRRSFDWQRWVTIGLVALIAIAAIGWWQIRANRHGLKLAAEFTSGLGVYKGSDVRILGVHVGTVDSVTPEGTTVLVKFHLDPGVKVAADESCRSHLVERRDGEIGFELRERVRTGEVEGADPGAAQCREVAAHTERGADVARERPDVRAGRAGDLGIDIDEQLTGVRHFTRCADGEATNGDRPAGEHDVLPRAHSRVSPLAVDLDGTDPRRTLLDQPGEVHRSGGDRVAPNPNR